MPLQRKGAAGQALQRAALFVFNALGLSIIYHGAVVDLYDHALAFHADVFGVPFIVLHVHFANILHGIEAAGAAPVALGVVHLHFIAFGRPVGGLELRMKEDAGVGAGRGHHAGLELEVFEIMVRHRAFVEQVGALAMHHDGAVLYRKSARVFACPPTIERPAIKQGDPAIIRRWIL